MKSIILTPAYGRDYRSAKEVMLDFDKGKDFFLTDRTSPWNGKPINKPQIEKGTEIKFRFHRQTKYFWIIKGMCRNGEKD